MNKVFDTVPKPAGMFSNRYTPDDMPDLKGKCAIVSGGSRGIGEAIVTALVMKGCEGELSTTINFLSWPPIKDGIKLTLT